MRYPLPSLPATLREPLGFFELPRLALRMPALLRAVPERPTATTVLPGFGADDRSTWPLRAYLRRIGHDASGWGLGVNTKNVPETVERVGESVRNRSERLERRIALIGWSLGGYIAEVFQLVADRLDAPVRRPGSALLDSTE
jgi:pimeloyl-ACP methyl ester carboxylesterase